MPRPSHAHVHADDSSSLRPIVALPMMVEVGDGHRASLIAIDVEGCSVRVRRNLPQGLVHHLRFIICESLSITVPCLAKETIAHADGTHTASFHFHLEHSDSAEIVAMLVQCVAPPVSVH